MRLFSNFFTAFLGGLVVSIWAGPIAAQGILEGRLQASLDGWRTENHITGVTMAVAAPDTGVIELASGLAVVADGIAMTPDRRLLISSMTKTFVAAAALQLVDDGKLKLDDRIVQWFPDFPNAADITIRQLLSHTSGATDYMSPALREAFAATALERRASGGPSFAPQELIDAGAGMPPEFPPGTSFAYSNTGYVLLGRIIEDITGEPLHVVLRARLFDPLGLQNTYLAGVEPIPGGWGPGYATEFAGLFGVTDGPALMDEPLAILVASSSWASGALVSTAGDVVRFQQALAGGKILQPSTLAEMIAPLPVIDDFVARMGATDIGGGLGVFLYPFPDPIGTGIGHDGGEPGFRSVMLTFPAHGISVAVLVNDGRPDFSIFPRGLDVDALVGEVVRQKLEERTGAEIRLGSETAEGMIYQDPAGRYSVGFVGDWTAVEKENGVLWYDYDDLPISMTFVAVENPDLAAAIAIALNDVGIDPDTLTETGRSLWNKWTLSFNSRGDGQGVVLFGQVRDQTSYVILATGVEELTTNPPEDAMASIQSFSFAGDDVLPQSVAEFEDYVTQAVGVQPPGLSIVIAGPGDIVYQRGFGFADGPLGIATTPQTVFHWGSVTKTVTATAIIQLREQGLLDLDAPIATYLDYVPADLPITARHLLTHSSGLPEAPDFVLRTLRLKGEPLPDFDLVAREVFTGLDELMFDPGAKSVYANPNYIILGQIVAALSGQDYVDYVRDHIFRPLGLVNTDFTYATETMRDTAAHGAIPADQMSAIVSLVDQAKGPGVGKTYFRGIEGDMAWFEHYIVGEAAGGGLMGPATELVRFGQMMLNNGTLDGTRVLSTDSVALLQEVQTLESGEPLGIGLSWFSGGDEVHPFIEHDGGGPGLQAKLRLYMKDGLAVAIMANGAGVERDYMADAAANVAFNMSAQ